MYDVCYVNVFDSFNPVIMFRTLRSKSSFLFGTHSLLDKPLRLLKIRLLSSNLTANG